MTLYFYLDKHDSVQGVDEPSNGDSRISRQ